MSDVKLFDIWSEGYTATGESAGAMLHGRAYGKSFKEACIEYAKINPGWAYYFEPDNLTYWGCRLFDNEEDARREFG